MTSPDKQVFASYLVLLCWLWLTPRRMRGREENAREGVFRKHFFGSFLAACSGILANLLTCINLLYYVVYYTSTEYE